MRLLTAISENRLSQIRWHAVGYPIHATGQHLFSFFIRYMAHRPWLCFLDSWVRSDVFAHRNEVPVVGGNFISDFLFFGLFVFLRKLVFDEALFVFGAVR